MNWRLTIRIVLKLMKKHVNYKTPLFLPSWKIYGTMEFAFPVASGFWTTTFWILDHS